jgi:molybdate transport system substrate-binding protein
VRLSRRAVLAGALAAPALNARAQTPLVVFAAGAVKAAVEKLLPRHDGAAEARYDTVGALRDRALAGERADIVLLSDAALDALARAGRLHAASRIAIGRTGVGLAAPLGRSAALRDEADLVALLRASPRIGYADPARGATAGTHFARTLERLNLTGPLAERLKVFPFGVEVIAAVGRGELDLGVSQATEIVAHPEVAFVGLLPDPHQIWTVYGVAATAEPSPAIRRALDLFTSDAAKAEFARIGFAPV